MPPTSSERMLRAPIHEFLDDLASKTPLPGGGAVAGVAVAMAAALCAMAARASRAVWNGAPGAVAQADALRTRAVRLAEANVTAYDEALTALRSPAASPGEARDAALARSLARAVDVPLAIAETSADVAELAALIAAAGDPAVRGDAIAAAVLAEAGARAARALVGANLGVTEDDERLVRAGRLAQAATDASRRAELQER